MFIALTNDGAFYKVHSEAEAVDMAVHYEIDYDTWSFNVFEAKDEEVHAIFRDGHDGDTLTHVRFSLVEEGFSMRLADEVIRILLNKGILFRVRS